MVSKKDTYAAKLRLLANGDADPRQISQWAVQEQLDREKTGDELSAEEEEILSNLQLAGALNEKGELLYTTADFKEWVDGLGQMG